MTKKDSDKTYRFDINIRSGPALDRMTHQRARPFWRQNITFMDIAGLSQDRARANELLTEMVEAAAIRRVKTALPIPYKQLLFVGRNDADTGQSQAGSLRN